MPAPSLWRSIVLREEPVVCNWKSLIALETVKRGLKMAADVE
ncbi:hypothetical protein [Microvirga sp. TS319]